MFASCPPFMFNSDSIFKIGSTHEECEDFALSGEVVRVGQQLLPHRYAIVCDGCSSSNAVSLGARLLAFSALNWLPNTFLQSGEVQGAYIATTARDGLKPFENLNLDTSILDATLLIAMCEPTSGSTKVRVWGDGVVVVRSGGVTEVTAIDYESGAPFYLSYWMNAVRHQDYLKEYGAAKRNIYTFTVQPTGEWIPKDGCETPCQQQYFTEVKLTAPGDFVALLSDGCKQFSDGAGVKMPLKDVVGPMTAFKNHVGRFVGRRIESFLKTADKQGVTFADDVSIAAIVKA